MIKKYRIKIHSSKPVIEQKIAYNLYGVLMHGLTSDVVEKLHVLNPTPVANYIIRENAYEGMWIVTLFGEQVGKIIGSELEKMSICHINKFDMELKLKVDDIIVIDNEYEFFSEKAQSIENRRLLRFNIEFITPAAFKSQGKYVFLPDWNLIIKSLIVRWNAFIPEAEIEDEDGSGIIALAEGLAIEKYKLESVRYPLKKSFVPGFKGRISVRIDSTGFHRDLLKMLFLFGEFAGIGIKPALGMGGIKIDFSADTPNNKGRSR